MYDRMQEIMKSEIIMPIEYIYIYNEELLIVKLQKENEISKKS